jgi:hypothetical protein
VSLTIICFGCQPVFEDTDPESSNELRKSKEVKG